MSEMFNKDWPLEKISYVLDDVEGVKGGFSYSKTKLTEYGIPQLRPYNITRNGGLDLSTLVYVPEDKEGISDFFLERGDVLFNNTNSVELVGKNTIVTKPLEMGYSNHIYRLRVKTSIIEPLWLMLCLRRHWIAGTFSRICKRWIGQAGVNTGMLKNIKIPLPSKPIQRDIIKNIARFSKELEKVVIIAQSSIANSKIITTSAINEIFSNYNKKKWDFESLLDYVEKDIETRDPKDNPKKEFKYVEIGDMDTQAKKINSYKTLLGSKAPSRARNVIRHNDVIYGTTRPYYRNVALIPKELDNEICTTGFCVLRLKNEEELLPKFLYYYLQSDLATNQIIKSMKGAHYPAVSNKVVMNLKIPIPKKGQQDIISRIHKIKEMVQNLIEIQKSSFDKINSIEESIVDKALRGNLK